jgi:hypothetical protein
MRAISLDRSAIIGVQIFEQALALQLLAGNYTAPWGTLQKDRFTRLCGERVKVITPRAENAQ